MAIPATAPVSMPAGDVSGGGGGGGGLGVVVAGGVLTLVVCTEGAGATMGMTTSWGSSRFMASCSGEGAEVEPAVERWGNGCETANAATTTL